MGQIDIIKQNTEHVIGSDDLLERIRQGKQLRIKLGVDPTRPDLTFGHMVVFNKMKNFQDMGHECILLIGDYTATIGDPSGRSNLRPILSKEQVEANAATYLEQAFKILDDSRTTVRYNSEWFDEMTFADALELSRKMTVARMLERDDFAKRYRENKPVSIVEFLYPLVQGYDSIMLQADVELGGSDQLFNMLVGRALQKEAGQPEQAVITMPLLIGLDGVKKMSKSADNYIAFNESPKDMFGKIMSISDEVMWDYYKLLLEMDEARIERHKRDHPMDAKKNLAASLVGMFHSLEEGQFAKQQFEQVFSKGNLPSEIDTFTWMALSNQPESPLVDIMNLTQKFPSKKEIRRLIAQGAVRVNEEKIEDPQHLIRKPAEPIIVQAGKRNFFKIEP